MNNDEIHAFDDDEYYEILVETKIIYIFYINYVNSVVSVESQGFSKQSGSAHVPHNLLPPSIMVQIICTC